MAEEGARVMIADRQAAGAARTCGELREYGADADTFVADISTAEAAQTLMAAAKERFGRIDILVNNAGGSMYGPKLGWEYTPDEIVQNVQNNFWTTLWCCWAVLPYMVEQRSGAIVNLGSNAPRGTMRLPYAASKGGVFAITTSLALETATLGIRINCVAPHWSVAGADRSAPGEPRGTSRGTGAARGAPPAEHPDAPAGHEGGAGGGDHVSGVGRCVVHHRADSERGGRRDRRLSGWPWSVSGPHPYPARSLRSTAVAVLLRAATLQ
jgi:NAD(P)-dependent dehydrogenase (short-subunit alcohol dehydrogenase family)